MYIYIYLYIYIYIYICVCVCVCVCKIYVVPRSKHTVSLIQTGHLMLYREIIAVCSETHTKLTNAPCG